MNKRYFSGQKGAGGLQFSCDNTFLPGAETVAAQWRQLVYKYEFLRQAFRP
jgi:hypothetical protein